MPEFTSNWFGHCVPAWMHNVKPIAKNGPLKLLEIGSHEGRSALWMLEHLCVHDSTTLTCIDPWLKPEIEKRFDANIAEHRRSRQLRKIRGWSGNELRKLTLDSFDFVYVDGSHEGCDCLRDGVMGFALLKVSGLMAFDDYKWNNPERKRHYPPGPAIDAFLHLWDFQIEVLHKDYQVIIRKLKRES